MANEAVRAAADQLVVGFDGNAATPVAAERESGPNSEEQAEDGYHNAEQHQSGNVWKDWQGQPRYAPIFLENEGETDCRRQQVLEPLPATFTALGGFAEKDHGQPQDSPGKPGASAEAESMVS